MTKKIAFLLTLLLTFHLVSLRAYAADTSLEMNKLLDKYLTKDKIDGISLTVIDYNALKKSPELKKSLNILKNTNPSDVKRTQRLAFFINAYNLLAIKTVVDAWPVDSIQNAAKEVWDRKAGVIGGKKYSLNQIEHDIIRKEFQDPRVHFALVCASVSCPDLRAKVYEPGTLNKALSDRVREFLANPGKGMRIDRENKIVWLSPLFKWYESDFKGKGGIMKFIMNFISENDRKFLQSWDYDIKYLDYNWKANAPSR